jgi:hypothetical protein
MLYTNNNNNNQGVNRRRNGAVFPFVRARLLRVLASVAVAVGSVAPVSAATTESAAAGFHQIKKVREKVATQTNSTTWVNVPGASAVFYSPANHRDLWNARFTAESACYGGAGWCSVRILLNGVEMEPSSGTDFAYDSTDANTKSSSSWQSHAMERSRPFLSGLIGQFVTVQVQYAVTNAAITFRLDDWHLAVEAHH